MLLGSRDIQLCVRYLLRRTYDRPFLLKPFYVIGILPPPCHFIYLDLLSHSDDGDSTFLRNVGTDDNMVWKPEKITITPTANALKTETYKNILKETKEQAPWCRAHFFLTSMCTWHKDSRWHSSDCQSCDWWRRYGWGFMDHEPYSPDPAPRDFHLIGPLKKYHSGNRRRPEASRHITITETCPRCLLRWDTSVYATVEQMFKCRWWPGWGVMCTTCSHVSCLPRNCNRYSFLAYAVSSWAEQSVENLDCGVRIIFWNLI